MAPSWASLAWGALVALARRAQLGFGMRVQYHQRNPLPASGMPDPAQAPVWLPLDELLCVGPRGAAGAVWARHPSILDESRLRSMKPTATLSNLARGGVVDDEALAVYWQMATSRVRRFDVFEGEPQVRPALLQQERVMLTPHMASASHATRRAMAWMAARQLQTGLMAMSGDVRWTTCEMGARGSAQATRLLSLAGPWPGCAEARPP